MRTPLDRRVTDEKGIRVTDETTTILGDEHQKPRPSWLSVDPGRTPASVKRKAGCVSRRMSLTPEASAGS